VVYMDMIIRQNIPVQEIGAPCNYDNINVPLLPKRSICNNNTLFPAIFLLPLTSS